jgi:uncharacterized protein (TIGR02145 family)/prepilin-type N-terminal cleavage/methylation domain-containing protein
MKVSLKHGSNQSAFTIVELLVVIVVIGILAAITIVAYTGISQKATASSLQSDLSNGSKKLKMYQVEYGSYPETMTSTDDNVTYCPTPEDTKYCIKPTPGNTFDYNSDSPYSTFTLDATNTNSNTTYNIADNTMPALGASAPAEPSIPTVTIGTQIWMQNNMNVGTKIDELNLQTDDDTFEKKCYANDDNNCTIYGGLYQWDEAMQYSLDQGAKGICPVGFHIPTDAEYTTLTTSLGGTSVAGDKMKAAGLCDGRTPCGTSGFNALLGGAGQADYWYDKDIEGLFWTSSKYNEEDPMAWDRSLGLSVPGIYRNAEYYDDLYSSVFSVRCLQN